MLRHSQINSHTLPGTFFALEMHQQSMTTNARIKSSDSFLDRHVSCLTLYCYYDFLWSTFFALKKSSSCVTQMNAAASRA